MDGIETRILSQSQWNRLERISKGTERILLKSFDLKIIQIKFNWKHVKLVTILLYRVGFFSHGDGAGDFRSSTTIDDAIVTY